MEIQGDTDDVQIVRLEEGTIRITLPEFGARPSQETAFDSKQTSTGVPSGSGESRPSSVTRITPWTQGSQLAEEEVEVTYIRKRRRYVTSGRPGEDGGPDPKSDRPVTEVLKKIKTGPTESQARPALSLTRHESGLQLEEMRGDGQMSTISLMSNEGNNFSGDEQTKIRSKSLQQEKMHTDNSPMIPGSAVTSGLEASPSAEEILAEPHIIRPDKVTVSRVVTGRDSSREQTNAALQKLITTLSTGATRILVKQPPHRASDVSSTEIQSQSPTEETDSRVTADGLPEPQHNKQRTQSSSTSMVEMHEMLPSVHEDAALYEAKEVTLSMDCYDTRGQQQTWDREADQQHEPEASFSDEYHFGDWEHKQNMFQGNASHSDESISRGRAASIKPDQRSLLVQPLIFADERRHRSVTDTSLKSGRPSVGNEVLHSASQKQSEYDETPVEASVVPGRTLHRSALGTEALSYDQRMRNQAFRRRLPFQHVHGQPLSRTWSSSSSSDDNMGRRRSLSVTGRPRHAGKTLRSKGYDRDRSDSRKANTDFRRGNASRKQSGDGHKAKSVPYSLGYKREDDSAAAIFDQVSKKEGEIRQSARFISSLSGKGTHGSNKIPEQVRKGSSDGTETKQIKSRTVQHPSTHTTPKSSRQSVPLTQSTETRSVEMSAAAVDHRDGRVSPPGVQQETSFTITGERGEIQPTQPQVKESQTTLPYFAESVSSSPELTSSSSVRSPQHTTHWDNESTTSMDSVQTAYFVYDSELNVTSPAALSHAAAQPFAWRQDEDRNVTSEQYLKAGQDGVCDTQKTLSGIAFVKRPPDTDTDGDVSPLEKSSDVKYSTIHETAEETNVLKRHTSATHSADVEVRKWATPSTAIRDFGRRLKEIRLRPLLLTRESSFSSVSERLHPNGHEFDSDNEGRSVLSRSSSNGFFTSESEIGSLVTFPRVWGKRRHRPSLTTLDPFSNNLDDPDDLEELTAKELRRRYSSEEFQPTSPFARRVQRFPSTRSEGARPLFLQQHSRAGHVRQLSLDIGEEWENVNVPRSPPVSPASPHDDQDSVFFGPSTSTATEHIPLVERKESVLSRVDTVKRRSHQTSAKLRLLYPKPFVDPLEKMDLEKLRRILSTLTPSEVSLLHRQNSPLLQLMQMQHRQEIGKVQQRRHPHLEHERDSDWQKDDVKEDVGQNKASEVLHLAGSKPVVSVQPMRQEASNIASSSQLTHIARVGHVGRRFTAPSPAYPTDGQESGPGGSPSVAVPVNQTSAVEHRRKPKDMEDIDTTGKRHLLPNPYNRINQRCHSTLQCPCCFFFCFLCCASAVYWMVRSDLEFDHGSLYRARRYGRRTTVLYSVGAFVGVSLLVASIVATIIYLPEELMKRRGW